MPLLNRVTGTTIANVAASYDGQGYVYGGTGARPGDWDCSSFVSYVLGRRLGLELPGGSWRQVTGNGTQHGPVVVDYANWTGARTVSTPKAGDLCCWVGLGTSGHVGIAISETEMVSALDPAQGVQRTPILGTGPSGSPLIYRQVAGVSAGTSGPTPPGAAGGGGGSHWWDFLNPAWDARQAVGAAVTVAFIALVPLLAVGLVVVGAAIVVTLGGWALRKATS